VNDQYHAFKNMHDLCVKGGLILHAFPAVGHWPHHGRYYYSLPFVSELARGAKYQVINIVQAPCYTQGRESDRANFHLLLAALQKEGDKFISTDLFQTLPIVDSGNLTHPGDYLPQDDKPFRFAVRAAAQELAALIPSRHTIILVDEDEFGGQ